MVIKKKGMEYWNKKVRRGNGIWLRMELNVKVFKLDGGVEGKGKKRR